MEKQKDKMSIGDLLKSMKDEFPDLTISKIRFLESEGLIEPERTPSGYRKFSQADARRLRFILKLQREKYLPLKVIREKIDELESGKAKAGDLVPGMMGSFEVGENLVAYDDATLLVEQAPQALDVEASFLATLEEFGLVDDFDAQVLGGVEKTHPHLDNPIPAVFYSLSPDMVRSRFRCLGSSVGRALH